MRLTVCVTCVGGWGQCLGQENFKPEKCLKMPHPTRQVRFVSPLPFYMDVSPSAENDTYPDERERSQMTPAVAAIITTNWHLEQCLLPQTSRQYLPMPRGKGEGHRRE
jgi:hypothetical protein